MKFLLSFLLSLVLWQAVPAQAQISLISALFMGTPKAAACVSGSCSDNFVGPASQLLATHNNFWVSISSSNPVSNLALTGSGSVQVSGSPWNTAGAVFAYSSSDTAQITFKAAPFGTIDLDRRVCVRAVPNVTDGYCFQLGYQSGTVSGWDRVVIRKSGAGVAEGSSTGWLYNADHTLRIVASGTTTVTVTAYVDGVVAGTYTDTTSPLGPGSPGFILIGQGHIEDLIAAQFQDF